MNNLWRRFGTRKSRHRSASDTDAAQNKPQEPDPTRNELVLLGNPVKRFDLEDILSASAELLGKGTSGTTYKADLEDGTTTVVVKRLKDVVLSAKDFRDRVEAVGAMDHENLLPLRGYFYSKEEKQLFYDYMPLGSLSSQLHGYRVSGRAPLRWEDRLSVALGAARAIEHLHAQDSHHGNIKSSNVLLTPSYEARVSDYGLVPLTSPSTFPRPTTADPIMADVYGFGVLLLELLTGKQPTQPHLMEEGVDLPAWVLSVAREEWTAEVFDVEFMRYHNVEKGMFELLEVAISCVSPNSHERPRMSEVRRKIEELCNPEGQRDGDSQPDEVSEGTKDTFFWLIPSARVDRDLQLDQFSEVNNDMCTRKPPDGVQEVSERFYGKNANQNKPQESQPTRTELLLLGSPAKRFDLADVMRASKQVLGKGMFGTTYKADLEDGTTTVVVKMLKNVVLSAEDFRDRVEAISAMDHENLLPLRGYFYSKDMKFLLYDYMPLESLSSRLSPYRPWEGPPLSWKVRLSIALGAARAIEHLHVQGRPYIHHGNIKPSKVLLTPSFEARVSDYGLIPLTRPDLVGSSEEDVYGFGQLLLEFLTGKSYTQFLLKSQGKGVDLPTTVQHAVRDKKIAHFFHGELLTYHEIEEGIIKLLKVAIRCVSPHSHKRPRMSEVRRKIEELNDTYTRRPPDGVLKVSQRVYIFDCCLTVDDGLNKKDHQILIQRTLVKVQKHFPDALFKAFHFGEQESQSLLSPVPVTNYPIHHGNCPILTMEMIHHFLRCADAWLSREDQRSMLLMHCERGGWPVLAFMLAALLLYRKKSSCEEKMLHLIYEKAPPNLLHLISPLHPLPSQLRYLQYISTSNVFSEGRLPAKALTLDSVILTNIPCLDAEVGFHLMFKIFGQDPCNLTDKTPTVLFSTPERGKDIRHYNQADRKLVKVDIHCPVQGDVVLECMSLRAGLEHEETMFRVMFNTAYLLANILVLGHDQMDVPWYRWNQYSGAFRAEITFSEMNPAASLVFVDLSGDEEQKENQLAKGAKKIEAQDLQVEDQAVYSELLSRDANISHEENEVREWPIQSDTAFFTSIMLPTLSSQLEASIHSTLDGSLASSDSASSSLSLDGSPVSFSAMLAKTNMESLQSPKEQLVSSLELSQDVHSVSVDSPSDEKQTECQIAERAKKIEAQELQVEDQAVCSALLSRDANTGHEENEVPEWPIRSDTAFLTSILLPTLSSQLEASAHSALDGSLASSDSASSSLSQHGSPVSFSALLTKKNIEPLQSPKQKPISSLELSQDIHSVSIDSPGDEEQTERQIAERTKKIEAQELQVEDQAVCSAVLSRDANTSHEENEVREWPIRSNTAFPTSILLPTLSSQLEASAHLALNGSLASSDFASFSLSQHGSPGSFSAMLTKKNIEPLQSFKKQLASSLELSQDVHSGESIQFHGWQEGIASVTAANFEVTFSRKCASSSTVSSDSVEVTKELLHNSAQILETTQEEKSCQLDGVTSSTSMSSGFDYDVFLSFRGPDTRAGITDFLYTSLLDAGIHTYRDDEELRIGEEIGPELLKAINHSKISIPIFSKGYAFSKWCLNELVQMVECRKSRRQKIMPIFYDVTPSEVRHQTGSYGDAFVAHEKQFDKKVISKWKAALKEVGDLKGWDIDSVTTRREGELVNHIVQKVIAELKKVYLLVTDCLVSVEHHLKEINRMVCGDSEDTQILGIHGMGGVGKTTLAKIIYNHLSHRFEYCCFLSNVRETSQLKGIECLQNQLLSDILKRNWSNISNVDDGIKTIKERLCGKKVLVLLDDVDKKSHLNALMGRPMWFGLGSMIIITSRSLEVFNVPEVCFTYELTGMDFNQSLQLFCKHAFGRDHPLDEYAALSNEVVKMTGGLPLALEVIGALLWGKSKDVWNVKLKKLEKVPHEEVKRKLKICYDALDDRQKRIFLDIACLFIGFDKRIVLHMWNDSNLFPSEGLQVLQQMSLIKIGEDNKLWMHDQLRDLGRDIVRQECNMELGKQTRLWNHEEALDIVMRKKGTEKVEALCLKFDHWLQQSFPYEELGRLSNLRYLEMRPVLDNWPPSGIPMNVLPTNPPILSELRWLSWHNFPPVLTLTVFSMMNMVILDLSWSKFSESWDGWSHIKMARNLKVLNLTGCAQLHRTPDLSANVKLEQLILESCGRLVQIDESIGQLKQLVLLNLRFCHKLRKLPEELANLESLKELLIDQTAIREIPGSGGMKNLETLSACECLSLNNCSSIGNLTSLLRLSLEQVEISQLSLEIGVLVKLEYLSLSGCNLLKRIPNSIGNLESLVELNLSHTHIAELPNSFGKLKNLKTLRMCSSSIRSIPSAIGMLEKLEEMDAENCQRLEGKIPDDIGRLLSLRILKFSNTRICYIPKLPESLLSLHIGTSLMTTLPNLSNLTNLTELNLEIPQVPEFCLGEEDSAFADMTELVRDPSTWWIGRLCNLESLKLSSDSITVLHEDIGRLSELKRLELLCYNLQFLPSLPSSLSCLLIKCSRSLETSIDLSNLKELSELRIYSSEITGVHGLESLENLQTLDLRALNTLERLPDFSNLKKLNELHLGQCHNLVDLQSIQGLGKLRILKLIEIRQLERLPDILNLKKLTELHLRQCYNLTEIQSFEGLENLIMLELGELPLLERLPNLSNLKKLTKLDVRLCHNLVKIQGRLDSLEELCIYGCRSLVEVPDPSSFKNLKSLQLRGCEMLQMEIWVSKSDTSDTVFGSSKCLMMRRLGICVCQLGRQFFLPSLPS